MDSTIVGGVLAALLVAIPTITAHFRRQARATRKENRKLRALVQEYDLHVWDLEREGWTRRGLRPPPRPDLLKALNADDDEDDPAESGREAGSSPRHAATG